MYLCAAPKSLFSKPFNDFQAQTTNHLQYNLLLLLFICLHHRCRHCHWWVHLLESQGPHWSTGYSHLQTQQAIWRCNRCLRLFVRRMQYCFDTRQCLTCRWYCVRQLWANAQDAIQTPVSWSWSALVNFCVGHRYFGGIPLHAPKFDQKVSS